MLKRNGLIQAELSARSKDIFEPHVPDKKSHSKLQVIFKQDFFNSMIPQASSDQFPYAKVSLRADMYVKSASEDIMSVKKSLLI